MIKAVIFDVGGVLVRTEDHSYRRKWEEELGLDAWESETIVFESDAGRQAEAGTIADEARWQWIGDHLSLDEQTLRQFRHDFWAGDVLDELLVDYIRSLRPAYQTAIISNAADNLNHMLSEVYPITDAFDLIVASAEEQVVKPEAEIFRRTLQRLGRAPEEAVFIDDSLPNVEAARALGMHGIHYQAGMDVPGALARLGVTTEKNEQQQKEREQ